MIWSLTLLNAVIPSYWNWAEETTSEAKSLHRQSLLLAIKEALDGTGNSPEYERIHERVVRTLAAMGKVVDPSLMNSMIVSQLLHELIQCDSRYASYIMLDRYRNGDHDVALFLGQLGLNAEQLKSLKAAPSELWLKALGKEDSLREALVGIEGGSIDFLKAAIQQ